MPSGADTHTHTHTQTHTPTSRTKANYRLVMIEKATSKDEAVRKLPLVIVQLDPIRTIDKGNTDVQKLT